MVKAAPRKPGTAQTPFALPGWALKLGAGALVCAFIVGLSVHFSPSEAAEDAAPAKGGKSAAPAATDLDDTTFEKFLADNSEGALVDFYSKDCKFCAKLAPEYEKAAKELKKAGGPALASVDAEVGPQMMQKFGINRYPTVYWFWKGENVLELPRASEKPAAKIVEWAKWAAGPAVQELDTRAEFDGALETLRSSLHAKARLMVAFNRANSEGLREGLEAAAQRHRATTVFLYIKEAGTGEPLMRSYGGEQSKDEDYEGATTGVAVTEWVKGVLDKAKPPAEPPAEPKEEGEKSAATKAMEEIKKASENAAKAEA